MCTHKLTSVWFFKAISGKRSLLNGQKMNFYETHPNTAGGVMQECRKINVCIFKAIVLCCFSFKTNTTV